MALITIDDVQAWFTTDRLSLDITDDLPEEVSISPEILASVSTRYDVSDWTTPSTTPQLIRSVISARVAAIRYSKQYADQVDEIVYADWLHDWAMTTLEGIINSTIPLLDIVTDAELLTAQTASSVKFFPTDVSSATDADPPKFTMDKVF